MQLHSLLCAGRPCQVCSPSVVQRQSHDEVQCPWGMLRDQDKLGEMHDHKQIEVKYFVWLACLLVMLEILNIKATKRCYSNPTFF